jgi:hypothetical protein
MSKSRLALSLVWAAPRIKDAADGATTGRRSRSTVTKVSTRSTCGGLWRLTCTLWGNTSLRELPQTISFNSNGLLAHDLPLLMQARSAVDSRFAVLRGRIMLSRMG